MAPAGSTCLGQTSEHSPTKVHSQMPLVLEDHVLPHLLALVARVQVVALGQGERGRSDEVVDSPDHRAGGVAEHAVDAHAELLVAVQLGRRLHVLGAQVVGLVLADQVGLDVVEFFHEAVDVDHEVPLDWEVDQWFHAYGTGHVVAQERGAGEGWFAVDLHAAGAADAHAAGPAKAERAVDVVLDMIQRVQHDPVVVIGHLVGLERRAAVVGAVAEDLELDCRLAHGAYFPSFPADEPYTRSAGGQRVITTSLYSMRGSPSVR